MRVLRPQSWQEALALRAEVPTATPVAGGVDVMVAMKLRHFRPEVLLDLSRIPGSADYRIGTDAVHCGSRVCHTTVDEQLRGHLPGLAEAARSIGSRQVRNRGTVGGSLGTAAATGDLHPMLLAAEADVELSSLRGTRRVSAHGFYRGQGRTALAADELITGVRVPLPAGPQRFEKIGLRQGLVKTLCSLALTLDRGTRRIRAAVGACGDMPVRALAAEQLLQESGALDRCEDLPSALVAEFGRHVAALAGGEGDADYRRRAARVLAARNLTRLWATFLAEGNDGHHRDGRRQDA